MKKKRNWKVWLACLMMAAGIGILAYPYISDWLTRLDLQAKVQAYQIAAGEVEDYSKLWKDAEEYNKYLAEKDIQFAMDEEETAWVDSLLNPKGTDVLGSVEIDKINVVMPIYRGTKETQLQSGAGWWYGTSLPTGTPGSHAVVTAHSGLAKAKYFTDLEKLEKGDKFTLKVLDKEFEYTVTSVETVEPDVVDPLLVVPDKDYVTLYTCTPVTLNTHRLLVTGEREHNLPKKSSSAVLGEGASDGSGLQDGSSGSSGNGVNTAAKSSWITWLAALLASGTGLMLGRKRYLRLKQETSSSQQ